MGHGAKDRMVRSNSDPFLVSSRREEHEKDISEIVDTITIKIAVASVLHSWEKSQHSIYRVPKNMREVNENAYIPRLVSIGPFHHKEPHLQYMEEHKLRFLQRILEQGPVNCCAGGGQFNQSILIGNLALAMKDLEHKTRNCYSETFNKMDSKSFVHMMILDGCFIVELLRLYYAKCQEEHFEDPISKTRWMMPILQRDFVMLENQLPFFVLQKLFELTTQGGEPSLGELTIKFFDPLMPREKEILNKLEFNGEHHHLLGLFRWSFHQTLNEKSQSSDRELKESQFVTERQLIQCVTELNYAGITFRKRENHDLLDIEFNEGVLEIPPLLVDDHTGPVFLNFVAYEQCDQCVEPYFTHYVLFFDSLVNSHKDVELLHYNGIINHVFGSDEDVANLFNKLCKEVIYVVDNSKNNRYLSKQLKDINNYYGTKWHQWRAKWPKWVHDYFSNPWSFSSLLAAIFLLLLTVIQAVFSIISYVRPPS